MRVEPAGENPVRGQRLGRAGGLACALGVLGLAVVCSIAIGSVEIPLSDLVGALFNFTDSDNQSTVRDVRIPRTLVGLAVGAALGCAGALIQGLTRNPLADPWILGIESGAAFMVVVAIFLLGVNTPSQYAMFALLGALVAWATVYALGATGGQRATPINLTLAGAALGALCTALTSAVIVLDSRTLDEYRFWAVGSVSDSRYDVLVDLLPLLLIGFLIALASGRALNALSLGDDVARALGQRVALSRFALAVAIVLLAGTSVAIAGPIGFVGLTVPHFARAIVGPDYRWILPYSAVGGAILVLTADIVGRVIARPSEVQVGIVMAVIGAPAFIALVRRRRLASL